MSMGVCVCGLTDNSIDSLAEAKKLFSRKQYFFLTLLDCKLMSRASYETISRVNPCKLHLLAEYLQKKNELRK